MTRTIHRIVRTPPDAARALFATRRSPASPPRRSAQHSPPPPGLPSRHGGRDRLRPTGAGIETVAAALLAAAAWAFVASLAFALRRGFRRRDWSAFGRYDMPDNTELIDWSTKSGSWLDMAVAEENERLMRGD